MGVRLVVGFGQGGVVAGALSLPRFVELALFSRAVQPEEGPELGEAWRGLRGVMVVGP